MNTKELEKILELLNEENGNTWTYSIEDGEISSQENFEEKVKWGNADEDGVHWNGVAPITFLDCQNKLADAQSAIVLENIQQTRKISYPSINEQLDMLYWDSVNGTTTWKDAIAQVKADNPKSE
jgi:hypothetical protein